MPKKVPNAKLLAKTVGPSGAGTGILRDLRGLIAEARQDVARQVNSNPSCCCTGGSGNGFSRTS